jgi:hypothetical protein
MSKSQSAVRLHESGVWLLQGTLFKLNVDVWFIRI